MREDRDLRDVDHVVGGNADEEQPFEAEADRQRQDRELPCSEAGHEDARHRRRPERGRRHESQPLHALRQDERRDALGRERREDCERGRHDAALVDEERVLPERRRELLLEVVERLEAVDEVDAPVAELEQRPQRAKAAVRLLRRALERRRAEAEQRETIRPGSDARLLDQQLARAVRRVGAADLLLDVEHVARGRGRTRHRADDPALMRGDEDLFLLALGERPRAEEERHRRPVAGAQPLVGDLFDLGIDGGCRLGVLLDGDAAAPRQVDRGTRLLGAFAAQRVLREIEERLLADLDGAEAEAGRDLADALAGADEGEAPAAGGAVLGEAAEHLRQLGLGADGVAAGDGGAAVQLEGDEAIEIRRLEVAPAVV